VLTAYAESDFKWDARSKNPVTSEVINGVKVDHFSEGAFQQTLPWWKNNHFSVAESCNAFLDNFAPVLGRAEEDCWLVQRWAAPDPRNDLQEFVNAPETQNYIRRWGKIRDLIRERRVV
jgi:hypothetical protein